MVLHYNAITFLIIHRMWKAFIVVYQAVNDTSGSARELQDSIKTYEIFNVGPEISMKIFHQNFLCSLWQRQHILCHTEAVKSLCILILSGERYLEGITKHSKFFKVAKMSHVMKKLDDKNKTVSSDIVCKPH